MNMTGEKNIAKNRKPSPFVLALFCFLALNAILVSTQPFSLDAYKFPYKGWSWWSMKDLTSNNDTHNVLFLGSSLSVSALNSADATYLGKSLDMVEYHRVKCLDHKLENRFGGTFSTFNLSAPGQMPSDAFLSVKASVKAGHRPDLILYGIAPRDFIDSELASPADTEPFRFLSRLVDIDDRSGLVYRSPLSKINHNLERQVYLYGKAVDMQMALHDGWQSIVEACLPEPRGVKPFTYWDRVKLLPEYKAGEFHRQASMCAPSDLSKPSEYIDNSAEYIERYRKPDQIAFKTQMHFLGELAAYCKANHSELVVINMPITKDNLAILKEAPYRQYMNGLTDFSRNSGTLVLDLNDHDIFVKEHFRDGVHMNAKGGLKFVDQLVDSLADHDRIATTLRQSGYKLERRIAVANKKKAKPL